MKIIISLTFSMFVFAGVVAAQPDSDPVLQGSVTYKMPQSVIDAEIDGTVVVGIEVDETGKPTKAVILFGPSWPCSTKPVKELEELSTTLSDAAMKLQFSPAIKKQKPVKAALGITLELKNPKLNPQPVEIDPATGKPKARYISGGVLNSKATLLPKPVYPGEAKVNRIGGSVTVKVLVDEAGNVVRAGVVSGPALLQFPTRDAVCGAKFSPMTLKGEPIKVSGVITYNFVPY